MATPNTERSATERGPQPQSASRPSCLTPEWRYTLGGLEQQLSLAPGTIISLYAAARPSAVTASPVWLARLDIDRCSCGPLARMVDPEHAGRHHEWDVWVSSVPYSKYDVVAVEVSYVLPAADPRRRRTFVATGASARHWFLQPLDEDHRPSDCPDQLDWETDSSPEADGGEGQDEGRRPLSTCTAFLELRPELAAEEIGRSRGARRGRAESPFVSECCPNWKRCIDLHWPTHWSERQYLLSLLSREVHNLDSMLAYSEMVRHAQGRPAPDPVVVVLSPEEVLLDGQSDGVEEGFDRVCTSSVGRGDGDTVGDSLAGGSDRPWTPSSSQTGSSKTPGESGSL